MTDRPAVPVMERLHGHAVPAIPAVAIVLASAASLAVAMGIGRFAYTSILPMMLYDGVLDLAFGSTLASANYLGYLIGAMLCMVLPRSWSSSVLIRAGLVATILLTLAMRIESQPLWIGLRFVAGVTTGIVLVHTSRWCLTLLQAKGKIALGSAMFAGVGLGIALSGMAVGGMVQLGWSSAQAWTGFAAVALVLVAAGWRVFRFVETPFAPQAVARPQTAPKAPPAPGNLAEMTLFSVAYGLAGFGYIVTATYLPVIARAALPAAASGWADLFWPAFGLAAAIGSVMVMRAGGIRDPRHALVVCYLLQAFGVVFGILMPTVWGFLLSSVLAGLPFTAINYFSMREVTRLKPLDAARYIGMLTAIFSIGQLVGPPMVKAFLSHTADPQTAFAHSIEVAGAALAVGGVIVFALTLLWPVARRPVAGR